MTRLFPLAVFASAALLFMVQPLAGKVLLPVLGGSPAVWSTCMVFFQTVLLLGYLYAHLISTYIRPAHQRLIHLLVVVAACALLPLQVDVGDPGSTDPRWWAIGALASTVGVPFLALSATAPLLIHWYSATDERSAEDPYFLYSASNAGSLVGLLGYLALEPFSGKTSQAWMWSVTFWASVLVVAACAYLTGSQIPRKARKEQRVRNAADKERHLAVPTAPTPAFWVTLAFVPSALVLGVTQHIATDVVSAPLLWVVPLAMYLAAWTAAFSKRATGTSALWATASGIAALSVAIVSLADVRYPIILVVLVHLAAFFVLTMLCVTRLAELRPGPQHLTAYFLAIAVGGALGSAAAAVIAPLAFSSILEYPLAIALALAIRPATRVTSSLRKWLWPVLAAGLATAGYESVRSLDIHAIAAALSPNAFDLWLQSLLGDADTVSRILRSALAIPLALLLFSRRTALPFAGAMAGLLIATSVTRTGGDVLIRERTFFGVHQVTSIQGGDWHELTHGTTMHGVQATRGRVHNLPTAYYHPSGPLGDLVFTLSPEGRFRDIGVVGLGAGAVAAYAGSGIRMDFFEIDDAVIRIAENPAYFTYLTDARARPGASIRVYSADGRLGLRAMPEHAYDLLVVDAFSSDTIPAHLLTREAISLYVSRLKPRGLVAFHVSSRFFDLPPVLSSVAGSLGLVGYVRNDNEIPLERATEAMRPSVWVVVGRAATDFSQLGHSAPRWMRLEPNPNEAVWTDDYSNVLGALHE